MDGVCLVASSEGHAAPPKQAESDATGGGIFVVGDLGSSQNGIFVLRLPSGEITKSY